MTFAVTDAVEHSQQRNHSIQVLVARGSFTPIASGDAFLLAIPASRDAVQRDSFRRNQLRQDSTWRGGTRLVSVGRIAIRKHGLWTIDLRVLPGPPQPSR